MVNGQFKKITIAKMAPLPGIYPVGACTQVACCYIRSQYDSQFNR